MRDSFRQNLTRKFHPCRMELSNVVRDLRPSATVHINDKSNELIAKGEHVFKWGLGQSPFPVPQPMVDALKTHAARKEYVTSQGLLELRQAIAARHSGLADDILIGPGSKELFFILQLCLECDLYLPVGSWVSYVPQARLIGRKVHWLPTSRERCYLLSGEDIHAMCRADPSTPKLLILNYPSNPHGYTYSSAALKEIAAAVSRYPNVLILADEIYGGVHHSNGHVSLAQFLPNQTIVSNGISKVYGAGGWRLGYLVFPPSLNWLCKAMTAVASETFTSVSAPIQCASIEAFRPSQVMDRYLADSQAILCVLATALQARLTRGGIVIGAPVQGAFYMALSFERWAKHFIDDEAVCAFALEKARVAFLPGSAFGWPAKDLKARISYVNFNGEGALLHAKTETVDEQFVRRHCSEVFEAADSLCNALDKIV